MKDSKALHKVLGEVRRLSLRDKIRLIQQLTPEIERDLASEAMGSRKSLRGLWRGVQISEHDIEEARKEMWTGFPREDV